MAYRFTNTEKWNDSWFSELKQFEKLLFIYLCDNCDIAGFYEINFKRIASDLDTKNNIISAALLGLNRGLIISESNDCLYIRNFLKHQKNLPLNEKNNAHLGIIKRFELYKNKFKIENVETFINQDVKPLPRGYGKGNGNGDGNDNILLSEIKISDVPFEKEETNELWQKLLSSKKWKNKSENAIQLSIDKLKKFDENFIYELIENAIIGNYQGLVFSDTEQKYKIWQNGRKTGNNSKTGSVTGTDRDRFEVGEQDYSKKSF